MCLRFTDFSGFSRDGSGDPGAAMGVVYGIEHAASSFNDHLRDTSSKRVTDFLRG
jgi:hypothetical protein